MSTRHVAVWLDHHEAKIFHVRPGMTEQDDLHVAHHLHHAHKTGGHAESHRQDAVDHPFYDEIAKYLADAAEVLVLGPSTAKTEFVAFVKDRHKDLAKKILGVEAADHPTDKQIVAHVQKYFRAADRLKP
jgi:stalled ribosome rescue protein Dom34